MSYNLQYTNSRVKAWVTAYNTQTAEWKHELQPTIHKQQSESMGYNLQYTNSRVKAWVTAYNTQTAEWKHELQPTIHMIHQTYQII